MLSRVLSLATLVWTLSSSALGVAFGAEPEKHAFLGMMPGEVTSEIASEYGVRSGEGVIVEGVTPESPAAKIGLRENDIIISVNSTAVTGPEEFRSQISKMNPGDKVTLTYVRGGKQKTATVELGSREEKAFGFMSPDMMNLPRAPRAPRAMRERTEEREMKSDKVAFAGIVAQNLTEGLATYFKVDKGALISEVVADSPAEKAGLKAGDIIVRIGDAPIEGESDVRSAIQNRKPGEAVDFVVVRDGHEQSVSVTLGEQQAPEMGDNMMEFNIPGLESLEGMHFDGVNEEQMRDLENKLKDLKIKIENIDPMDIRIEQLPDHPGVRIEKYIIGPVRDNNGSWQRSLQRVGEQFRQGFNELKDDFVALKDQFVALSEELLGRTA